MIGPDTLPQAMLEGVRRVAGDAPPNDLARRVEEDGVPQGSSGEQFPKRASPLADCFADCPDEGVGSLVKKRFQTFCRRPVMVAACDRNPSRIQRCVRAGSIGMKDYIDANRAFRPCGCVNGCKPLLQNFLVLG